VAFAKANIVSDITRIDNTHNIDAPYWARLKSGDPDALGYLYDRYVDALFAVGLKLTQDRDQAKDAVQEVFVDLWLYRNGIGTVDYSLAYLQRALRNKLFRQLRTVLRRVEMPDSEKFVCTAENSEESMISVDEEKETGFRLTRALSCLSQRQREVVTLHFYQGLSYEQIADKLCMNYQSVNNLVYRTMLRLRDNMLPLLISCLFLFRP